MYHGSLDFWKKLLDLGLEEDGWRWDWTTLGSLRSPDQRLSARIVAKSEGIWAAEGLVKALPPELEAKSEVRDGSKLAKGQTVVTWSGPGRLVLAYERGFLNLASYAGGIATQTRSLVDIVSKAGLKRAPRVCSTRKILPFYRDLAIHSVQAGGGHAHRLNLAGGVLIKENHIAAAGGIDAAILGARAVAPHGLKIEIEVRSLEELESALRSEADAVLLDNFTPDQVRAAIAAVGSHGGPRPVIEVSGGLNAANVASYAIEGVDVLSFGSLTHSVQSLDLSLLVGE
jgi:nicotinate-nucleotide pyrophosphorylase (carboxylating)